MVWGNQAAQLPYKRPSFPWNPKSWKMICWVFSRFKCPSGRGNIPGRLRLVTLISASNYACLANLDWSESSRIPSSPSYWEKLLWKHLGGDLFLGSYLCHIQSTFQVFCINPHIRGEFQNKGAVMLIDATWQLKIPGISRVVGHPRRRGKRASQSNRPKLAEAQPESEKSWCSGNPWWGQPLTWEKGNVTWGWNPATAILPHPNLVEKLHPSVMEQHRHGSEQFQ